MRPVLFVFLFTACISLFSCQTNEQLISRRWVFTGLETPTSKAMAKAFDPGLIEELTADLRKKIKGNRLILDKNGTCYGVLLSRYFTGHWDYNTTGKWVITHLDYPEKIDLKWNVDLSGLRKGKFDIEAGKLLQMNETGGDSIARESKAGMMDDTGVYTITAESESDDFDEKDADPWSPALNKWRLKPAAPEDGAAIKERVRNHLHFMYSFFSFAIREERYWVSQDWFFSVIKPGNNGMALLSVKKIPDEWYNCFYDSTEAMQGYELLRKTFHKEIKVPKESNGVVFNKLMLEQLLSVYDK